MEASKDFASKLRWWRAQRGISQLDLAHEAKVSQRHVSFLELGRTAPSRAMVLRLCAALGLSLREQNALLLSAGYAPIWRQTALEGADMAMVGRALDFMLGQHEPFPAFVVDRRWNLLRANEGARRFVGFLTDGPPFVPDSSQPINLADALLAPKPLRPWIKNWSDVAAYFVQSVRADALVDGTEQTRALLNRLLGYPDVGAISESATTESRHDPVLTMDFVKGDTPLRLFTTLAALGTPLDVTAEEIRIECFFPADEATTDAFKAWGRSS